MNLQPGHILPLLLMFINCNFASEAAHTLGGHDGSDLTVKAKEKMDDDDGTAVKLDETAELPLVLEHGIWLLVYRPPSK